MLDLTSDAESVLLLTLELARLLELELAGLLDLGLAQELAPKLVRDLCHLYQANEATLGHWM